MKVTETIEYRPKGGRKAGKNNRESGHIEAMVPNLKKEKQMDNCANADNFASHAAHELKTPLTILRGELELALRDESADNMQLVVASALDEVIRLSGLVDDILDMAKAETGNMAMAAEPFDMAWLLADLTDDMRIVAEEKGVCLIYDAVRPIVVLADKNRIKQALLNLIENAVKYTNHGGTVRVSLRLAGSDAVITVQDNGIGISREDISRIFKKYFRASNAHSMRCNGLGLGLAITEKIIKASGGTIAVDSELGRGTEFRVSLPAAQES